MKKYNKENEIQKKKWKELLKFLEEEGIINTEAPDYIMIPLPDTPYFEE